MHDSAGTVELSWLPLGTGQCIRMRQTPTPRAQRFALAGALAVAGSVVDLLSDLLELRQRRGASALDGRSILATARGQRRAAPRLEPRPA